MGLQTEAADKTIRFVKMLPIGKEPDIVILKGHLLLEEAMTEWIDAEIESSNPLNIDPKKLSFSAKLNLLWALSKSSVNDEEWLGIKQLNLLRNKMSHSLEPKGLEQEILKLQRAILPLSSFTSSDFEGKELEFSIAWLYVIVTQRVMHRKSL